MKILIRGGRIVDPASGLDRIGDLAIASGRLLGVGQVSAEFDAERTIDAAGLVVAPGLVDLAARLREPGREHEGMLESELAAAAAGAGAWYSVQPPPSALYNCTSFARCASRTCASDCSMANSERWASSKSR